MMSKKVDIIKLTMLFVITAVIMAAASLTIYATVAKPEFYNRFIENGYKYLEDGQYSESVIEFDKAIRIEAKSTQARVGRAQSEIGLDRVDDAVDTLKEAQSIDLVNKVLLLDMIEILKDVDPDAAYELLMNYVNEVGEENLDDDIRQMLDSAKEEPEVPALNPIAGTYIKPFSLRLKSEKFRLGHSIYYTIDGTAPDKNSTRFKGSIKIDNNVSIKFIAYNPEGKVTEVVDADYVIDTELIKKIEDIIRTAKEERDKTEEGTAVGNCIAGAKAPLNETLDSAERTMKKEIISYEDGEAVYNAVNSALSTFRTKIIPATDKSKLNAEISRAENLLKNAVEGSDVNQYRSGAKEELNSVLREAKNVRDDLLARQKAIDNVTSKLTAAIEKFNSKRITETDKIFENAGAQVGPVTVSLLWNTIDDLDLHVTSPRGDTISYKNKVGASGGMLDVDRQVESYVSNPVENIFWSNPPSGTYTVKVDVFTKRTSGSIPITVRTVINGESKIYTMNISDGMNSICSFTY